jgi:predicted glycoside hydrolase/deacetylase ChbG (UPF0249 family)
MGCFKGGGFVMEKFLIVNADDFGISEGVSRGVIEGHRHGIISSSSVMINMPFAKEAIRKAKCEAPGLGLGLHINLTWGRPVLSLKDVSSLVSSEGIFQGMFHLGISPPEPDHVRSEILAQFNHYVEIAGEVPDHLDSHQFVTYVFPVALSAMLDLAAEHELPIRSPMPFFDPAVMRDMIDATMGDAFSERAMAAYRQYIESGRQVFSRARHTRWPDHFEYHFYDKGSNKDNLVKILQALSPGTTEIMCHPGYGMDLEKNEGYRELREQELGVLMDPEIKEVMKSERIELVKFTDL